MKHALLMLSVVVLLLGTTAARADVIHSDYDPGGTYYGGLEGWFNYGGVYSISAAVPGVASSDWMKVQLSQQYWGVRSRARAGRFQRCPSALGMTLQASTSM